MGIIILIYFHIFQRGRNHQPQPVLEETSKLLLVLLHSSKLPALQFFEWKFNLPGKVDLGIPDSLMVFSKFTPRFLYETLQLW
jgi:hypothetical protein